MRHEFALYTPHLSSVSYNKQPGDLITISDESLWHRLKHVLRAQAGVAVYLFDHTTTVEATLSKFEDKNQLQFSLTTFISKVALTPAITVLLPLLKRESFADALYSCVELGASHIQLVITEKSVHGWTTERDMQRCQNIMRAAAEQSKQFSLPILKSPLSLYDALHTGIDPRSFRINCDPQGSSLWSILNQLNQLKPESIVMSFGPEGDFTETEKTVLRNNQFLACALTPTVLRSTQALVVMLGALRSSSRT